jgi:hypothetical protein
LGRSSWRDASESDPALWTWASSRRSSIFISFYFVSFPERSV